MTKREARSAERRKKITIKKTELHSAEHHSFHFELSDTESFSLLRKMSLERWQEENGYQSNGRVDRSMVKIIHLKDK